MMVDGYHTSIRQYVTLSLARIFQLSVLSFCRQLHKQFRRLDLYFPPLCFGAICLFLFNFSLGFDF
jgi:hypothetical protein